MTLSSTARQIIFWLLIVAGAVLLYRLVNPSGKSATALDLQALYQKIDAGEIVTLTVKQNETTAIDNRNLEYKVQLTNEQIKNELFKKANEKTAEGKTKVARRLGKQQLYLADVNHLGAALVYYRYLGLHAAANAVGRE